MHRVTHGKSCYRALPALLVAAIAIATMTGTAVAGAGWNYGGPFCQNHEFLCTEHHLDYGGAYVGHDEPSLLLYGGPGAGTNYYSVLTLPKDSPALPKENGRGGTYNFQLHPAFWYGMALCDTQSAPEYTTTCTPDSDANIFDNSNSSAPDYIGFHPGAAFMELQFYPPGWVSWPLGVSCDSKHWCAALNIDSLSLDMNNDVSNNSDCLNKVGEEPVNFAFITLSGVATTPANPLNINQSTIPDLKQDLLMNPGDKIAVSVFDTPTGLKVVLDDLTTRKSGSMVASIANGFAQTNFDPSAATCSTTPYAFHPMYQSATAHTRVPWAAHSYNVAFADEIGHFEYCDAVDSEGGNCISPGVDDPSGLDSDDTYCFDATASTRVRVGGCLASELDFDGAPYGLNWPGTDPSPAVDLRLHPQPIRFTTPLYTAASGQLTNYNSTAFETDLAAFENCNQLSGSGCVNPPPGAAFYPVFSTSLSPNLPVRRQSGCNWQLGGTLIPHTAQSFGDSAAEYGAMLQLAYPAQGGPEFLYTDFRQILSGNPCQQPPISATLPKLPINFGVHKVGSVSPARRLNIFNPTAIPLTISGATIDDPQQNFALASANTGNCPTLLGPGGSCYFAVVFQPHTSGPLSATFTLNSNADNASPTVTLKGGGR